MSTHLRVGGASEAELLRHPWAFTCDVPGCHYTVCADSQADADRERFIHGCPRNGVTMIGESLLERIFAQLDAQVDNIFRCAGGDPGAFEISKAVARGQAEVIVMICAPHFSTVEEVSAEAGTRHAYRAAGEPYSTVLMMGQHQTVIPT